LLQIVVDRCQERETAHTDGLRQSGSMYQWPVRQSAYWHGRSSLLFTLLYSFQWVWEV